MDPKFKAVSDLASLICSIANSVISATKPLSIASLSLILPLLPQIEVVAGEISLVPSEIGQLDAASAEALLAQVASQLQLENAKASAVVAASLQVITAGFSLASALKS